MNAGRVHTHSEGPSSNVGKGKGESIRGEHDTKALSPLTKSHTETRERCTFNEKQTNNKQLFVL